MNDSNFETISDKEEKINNRRTKATRVGRNRRFRGSKSEGFEMNKGDVMNAAHPSSIKTKHNDLNWYTNTPSIVDPTLRIPALPIAGQTVRVTSSIAYDDNGKYDTLLNPGIMVIKYQPFYPLSLTYKGSELHAKLVNQDFDPIKQVAMTLYAQLRKNLNGPRKYNAADLIAYLMVMGSILPAMEQIKLGYKMSFFTSALSRYSRRNLTDTIFSRGVYDNWVTKAPLLISKFNQLVLMTKSLLLPTSLPLIDRWKYLSGSLFRDSNSNINKAQVFKFKQTHIYKLDYTGATPLAPYEIQAIELNDDPDRALSQIQEVISQLLNNDVIAIINADIAKLFDVTHSNHIEPMVEDYDGFQAHYDATISYQLKHLRLAGFTVDKYSVIMEPNTYDFNINGRASTYMNADNLYGGRHLEQGILATADTTVDKALVIYGTRMGMFMRNASLGDANELIGFEFTCGTELYYSIQCHALRSLDRVARPQEILSNLLYHTFRPSTDVYRDSIPEILSTLFMSMFKDAPIMYLLSNNYVDEYTNQKHMRFVTPVGDIDSYAILDFDNVAIINNAVLTSLLGLTDSGTLKPELYKLK